MKRRPTQSSRKGDQSAILVRLPTTLHRHLKDRAADQQRSVVGHIRYLIEQDKEAA